MRAKIKKNSGFTLLEIIIVIIIVGVLAALALPKFFSTIEQSRAAEAFGQLNAVRGAMERCYLLTGEYDDCSDLGAALDIEDPNSVNGRLFDYVVSTTSGSDIYTITATRNTVEASTQATGSKIELSVDPAIGVSKSGTTVFKNIK